MFFRLLELEQRIREPGSIACVDSLLDTVTALIADCSLDPVKQLKNIEAYNSRCKWRLFSIPPLANPSFPQQTPTLPKKSSNFV
jgi:hypothetical protein